MSRLKNAETSPVRAVHLVVDLPEHVGLVVVHGDHLVDAGPLQHLRVQMRRRRLSVELLVRLRPRHLGMVRRVRSPVLGREEQVRFDQHDTFGAVLLGRGRDQEVAHRELHPGVLRGRSGDEVDALALEVAADPLEIGRIVDETGTELRVGERLQRDDVGDLGFLSYVVGGVERERGIRPVGHDHQIVPVVQSAVHLPPFAPPRGHCRTRRQVCRFPLGARAGDHNIAPLRGGRPVVRQAVRDRIPVSRRPTTGP